MTCNIFATKTITETLDGALLNRLCSILLSYGPECDYLQVFQVEKDRLIHTQEVPQYRKEYKLSKKYSDYKLFAIRTDEEKTCYWTIMFAEEY